MPVQVSQTISPNDRMFRADHYKLNRYMSVGQEAVELLARYCDSAERVLDFGCGHGRVLRFLVAHYPEAEIWACDIEADAVQFCEREFGVKGLLSAEDANQLALPRFDLIWVGSVFSHLPLGPWRDFMRLLAQSLTGTLVFSIEGPSVVERIRGGLEMGVGEGAAQALSDYDATGFGYSEYVQPARIGYGLALVSPARAQAEIEAVGLDLVAQHELGWMSAQDVVVAQVPR